MKKMQNLAGQMDSIREGWTEQERERRRHIADLKLLKLCHLLAESSAPSEKQLEQERNSQVATAC